jgi:CubicO group peptidase (beta-lactamase class C family)
VRASTASGDVSAKLAIVEEHRGFRAVFEAAMESLHRTFAVASLALLTACMGTLGACSDDSGEDGSTTSASATTASSSTSSDETNTSSTMSSSDTVPQVAFDQAIEAALARPEMVSVQLGVATEQWSWFGGGGQTSLQSPNQVQAGAPFIIHSITKTMTAAAALRAVDQGKLALDAPIGDYLAADVIAGLHIIDGHDYGDRLTLRLLLNHRSGLADYFFDGQDENGNPPFFADVLFVHPTRTWTPDQILTWTRENLQAVAIPDTAFHYSDTNYVLAGLILEQVYSQPLAQVFRTQVFEPLGMKHSWMLFGDTPQLPPGQELSHVFYQDIDLTEIPALSADWGGGGLVSTSEDLHRFLRGVFEGGLLSEASVAAMRTYHEAQKEAAQEYGLGIMRFVSRPMVLEGHGGFGGAFMFYDPNAHIYIVGTTNQAESESTLMADALGATYAALAESQRRALARNR